MKHKIFIVEDSPTQLEQLKIILEEAEYDYNFAEDGKDALNKIKIGKPHLVITDIVMPEMDGYELCNAIKSDPELSDISVMLLTTLSDPEDVIKGLEAGADNFLTKPYNPDLLLSRIHYVLANREIRTYSGGSEVGIDIFFGGKKYRITSDRMQIIDLLLSTYENAIQKNVELKDANKKLTEMHRELAKKNIQLEKLNDDKNKFLRMAAHDIRNPVGLSLSYSTIILEDYENDLNEEVVEFLNIIRSSSDFVIHLLDELLNVAVIESGDVSLNYESENLVELTKRVITFNKIFADKKSMKLVFNSNVEELSVKIDKIKIEQVLNNLISNAIKYSYPETEINIILEKNNTEVKISVSDKGQGIQEDELENLFEPFAKASSKTTGGESSTGLGLSIVKKIIEAHSGEVGVESELGNGATFYFILPL